MSMIPSAAQFAVHVQTSAASRALVRVDQTPGELFDHWLAAEFHQEAIQLLPHLLPKRRAVWWGCLCAWDAYQGEASPICVDALQGALRWVVTPSEVHRVAARPLGEAADLSTPAGCLALAAGFSDGSMLAPELPSVPVPPELTARLVGAAVLLAAAEREPMRFREHYRRFLDLGRQVADGLTLWTTPGEESHVPSAPPWIETSPVLNLVSVLA